MYRKWTFRYTTAAVLAALTIIAISIIAIPLSPIPTASAANFAVLFTDPPTVPAGTTQLNMTYSGIALHVTYSDESVAWIPVEASGTVNLFSLINVTKTIAATTLPAGTKLDKVQFSISNVTAEVNEKIFNVTTLADSFVVNVINGEVNQTLSGVLIDFNPTLVQIQASDENGTKVDYYVLVPSANAMIVSNLEKEHIKVGTIVQIGENTKVRIKRVVEELSKNVTIVSATLKVDGNKTSLSITLENTGDFAFRIFGLTLHGQFNTTRYESTYNDDEGEWEKDYNENVHTQTIPFKVSNSALIPLLGDKDDRDENDHDSDDERHFSSTTVQPSETVTLSFEGVIDLNHDGKRDDENDRDKVTVLAPVLGTDYTIKLMGEGNQIYSVQATA